MDNSETLAYYEQTKTVVLSKIQNIKDKWQSVAEDAQGIPDAEAELIHLRLEIQIIEAHALKELKKLWEKIKTLEGERL